MALPVQEHSESRRRLQALGVLLLAGVTLGLGISCDDHVIGTGAPIKANCLRSPPLTWENYGDYIVGRQCRSCHSTHSREGQRANAPVGVDFDTWDDVLQWADSINRVSVESESMPPAGGMLKEERELLGEWLRCEVFPALGQVDLEGVGEEGR